MKVFITGSSGLIGSELVSYFDQRAQSVVGTDNNMRADFFGPEGDTTWNLRRLMQTTRTFMLMTSTCATARRCKASSGRKVSLRSGRPLCSATEP
jgi:nucleoside-diphosphate-sugar epimerase